MEPTTDRTEKKDESELAAAQSKVAHWHEVLSRLRKTMEHQEVLAIGVEKETGSDILLDDECLFRSTPPTVLSPLASPWCQTLR